MTFDLLIFEKNDRIATITLNRPQSMNAINAQLARELERALAAAEQDDEVDVVVITGSGKAFCAGRDLKEFGQNATEIDPKPVFAAPAELTKPVIAALNGFALTGGLELALNCDIIIAAEGAKLADTHTRVGVMPNSGMTQLLPRLVGIKKAKELSLTGNFFTAEEALAWGLVNRVVPREALLPTARQLARDIAAGDQAVVRNMKRIIDEGEGLTLDEARRMERDFSYEYKRSLAGDAIERRRQAVIDRGRAQAGQ